MQGTWINKNDSSDRIIIKDNFWTFVDLKKGGGKEKYTFVPEEDVRVKKNSSATCDKVWLFRDNDEQREFIMISSGPKTLWIEEKGKKMRFYTNTNWLDYLANTESERKTIQNISDSILNVFKQKNKQMISTFFPSKELLIRNLNHIKAKLWTETTGVFSEPVYQETKDLMINKIETILAFGDSIGFHWNTSRMNGKATVHFWDTKAMNYGYTDLWINDDQSMSISVYIEMMKIENQWYITPSIRRSGYNDLKIFGE